MITCNIDDIPLSKDYKGPFNSIKTFGEVLFEIKNCGGWVTSVAINLSGNKFAFSVHDTTLHHGEIAESGEIK